MYSCHLNFKPHCLTAGIAGNQGAIEGKYWPDTTSFNGGRLKLPLKVPKDIDLFPLLPEAAIVGMEAKLLTSKA